MNEEKNTSKNINLYEKLGFKENPFSRFSAEEEIEYLPKIYIKPNYYTTLYSAFKSGNSRYVFGERGIGKSALLIQLKDDLSKDNVFSIIVDEFHEIPHENNRKDILLLIIRELIKSFSVYLLNSKEKLKNLDKIEKEKLSFLINEFFSTISKTEFDKINGRVSNYKTKKTITKIFNSILNKPLNILISSTIEIVSDVVTKSLGLPNVDVGKIYKSYVPEIKIKEDKFKPNLNYNSLKIILSDLILIIKKTGFNGVVVFFDKIDEQYNLEGNREKIVGFLEDWLKDTNLLLMPNLALGITIWSKVRRDLNKRSVRFDKIKPIDISWKKENLKAMLKKRIQYFANSQYKWIDELLDEPHTLEEILTLANNSPRDLLRIFSTIYEEEESNESNHAKISYKNVKNGMIKFIKEYDYESYFPHSDNKEYDAYYLIKLLLSINTLSFANKYCKETLGLSDQSSDKIIQLWENYNFVKIERTSNDKSFQIIIIDPKIRYLIVQDLKGKFLN